MGERTKQESIVLLIGDLIIFVSSLWLTLLFRKLEIPNVEKVISHLVPFITIFIISTVVFFIAGLYERNSIREQTKLLSSIIYAQIANVIFAISFFYFIPVFGIYPKINLFLYIIISTFLITMWRIFGEKILESGQTRHIILVGNKKQVFQMKQEFAMHAIHRITVVEYMDVEHVTVSDITMLFKKAVDMKCAAIVVDLSNNKIGEALSDGYDFFISNILIYDINQIYENTFNQVSLHSINYSWIVETNKRSYVVYDFIKRFIDVSVSIVLVCITFPFFPLVAFVIRLEEKGKIFITQKRVGKRGKIINMYKFRTMKQSDDGVWLKEKGNENKVTRVGYILRKTRIDELPQLINVIRGDISLIGPRPDIVGLGQKLMKEIPYYMTRYSVLPGLSGWAQINQVPPQSVEETKLRFAYDLYYVKHRSVFLDIKIALRTIYEILSRNGM